MTDLMSKKGFFLQENCAVAKCRRIIRNSGSCLYSSFSQTESLFVSGNNQAEYLILSLKLLRLRLLQHYFETSLCYIWRCKQIQSVEGWEFSYKIYRLLYSCNWLMQPAPIKICNCKIPSHRFLASAQVFSNGISIQQDHYLIVPV